MHTSISKEETILIQSFERNILKQTQPISNQNKKGNKFKKGDNCKKKKKKRQKR